MTSPKRDARSPAAEVRLVRDTDSPGIISLIARCFADYPGCVLDVEGEEPHLLTPEASFERFWVVEFEGEIVGTIACSQHRDESGHRLLELKKLYLDSEIRGQGLARRLVALVEDYARDQQIETVDLWTDTRFETAHGVYTHFGYTKLPATRELHDKSDTVEYYFKKAMKKNRAAVPK